jgi:hypothetical protein
MLTPATVETLHKQRLRGLADAYLRQLQDPQMNELSIEERFGLLVDHHWNAILPSCSVTRS